MPNDNNDSPDQAFAKSLIDQLASRREIIFESGKQQDNIAVWLVSMSTGSIALVISQFQKFGTDLYPALKISVFFLTATVILGLLFRIFHLLLQEKERNNWLLGEAWLVGYSEKITESPAIKSMLESFHKFLANLEGIPIQKYKRMAKSGKSIGIRKRRLKWWCKTFYISMCISFAVSVSFISYNFIKTDFKASPSAATANQKAVSPAKQIQLDQTNKSD